jgi:hypothetical protein
VKSNLDPMSSQEIEINKNNIKENNNEMIKKINLNGDENKNDLIKVIKNLINSNNVRRDINNNENDEKNKEDKNKNKEINIKDAKNTSINNLEDKNIDKNNENIINTDKKKNKINNKKTKDFLEEEKNEEDPLIDYMKGNIKINDLEIKNSPKIILEEINCNLLNGNKIEINAAGMIGGRNKNDGFSIFGQKKLIDGSKNSSEDSEDDIKSKENNPFIPDFELNYPQFLSYPYIFTIYFKKEEKSFYIKAFSGKGSDNKVLFIKLNNKNIFILNKKELIFTGNVIFQVTPLKDNCLEIINLSKKNFNNCNRYVVDGFNKKTITIGRNKDCDFSFPKDKSFSRFQTTLEFDEEIKKWSIIDGYKDKDSTNGTWLFGTHSFKIKNEMIVEILNSQIKITEIKE